jgi:hypothetical protein
VRKRSSTTCTKESANSLEPGPPRRVNMQGRPRTIPYLKIVGIHLLMLGHPLPERLARVCLEQQKEWSMS